MSPPAALTAHGMLSALRALGTSHVIWLPDSESAALYLAFSNYPELQLVPVAREGESLAIAAGLLAGGRRPVVAMQSTGFFEAGDSLRGLGIDCALPVLMLVGYRGYREQQPVSDSAARYLEPLLSAWELPYYLLGSDDELLLLRRAWQQAREESRPVAVLMTTEYQ